MLEMFLTTALSLIRSGLGVIFDFYFLWLPVVLFSIFWSYWKSYVVTEALLKEETSLIQVRLPKEITKSPKAMELFLQNLHQSGGEGNFYDRYWKGGTRPWFSLELVSINGEIRFYIWTRKKFAKAIETGLYSQYPNIEVLVDAEDYTKKFEYDPEKKEIFGSMFTLTKDDPYPIKTYIDFGLGDDPKEEFKIDPIAAMMEFLGSVGQGEQVWVQILIRAHKKYEKKSIFDSIKKIFSESLKVKSSGYKNFEEKSKQVIKELKEKDIPKEEAELEKLKIRRSKFQDSIIEAIERSVTKPVFDTAIRALYLADKEKFDKANIGGLLGSLKQYSSDGLNGFKPKKTTSFDFPWQDISGKALAQKKSKIFNGYIKRAGFETRHNIEDFILNTEELATIFHFPSSVIETPTLPRVLSKKVEPPTNLPL